MKTVRETMANQQESTSPAEVEVPDRRESESVDLKETGRIEAFSDGIFAVAITLLVLSIQIPKIDNSHDDSALGSALLGNWSAYLAFLTSFLTIGIMWVNHHRLFNH